MLPGMFMVLVLLTLALTTGCSMSLVDKTPEILQYCRVVERSEPAGGPDAAGPTPGSTGNAATSDCAGGTDRVCEDDEIVDAIARGEVVNCTS